MEKMAPIFYIRSVCVCVSRRAAYYLYLAYCLFCGCVVLKTLELKDFHCGFFQWLPVNHFMNELHAAPHTVIANELNLFFSFMFRAKMKGFSPWPGRVSAIFFHLN